MIRFTQAGHSQGLTRQLFQRQYKRFNGRCSSYQNDLVCAVESREKVISKDKNNVEGITNFKNVRGAIRVGIDESPYIRMIGLGNAINDVVPMMQNITKSVTPSSSTFQSSNFSTKAAQKEYEEISPSLTIEEQYSRKTPLEHILLRPGMYVGPVERSPPVPSWIPHPLPPPPSTSCSLSTLPKAKDVIASSSPQKRRQRNSEANSLPSTTQMKQQNIPSHPALIKIFDEILVNAFDNRLRHHTKTKNSSFQTNQIDVIIFPGDAQSQTPAMISVQNNGKGIPVQIHKKEQMYLPEMLFGHLLTGSNFDDESQKKVTGGRHGYGAKLTNIFSQEFQVDTYDSVRKKTYSQRWDGNMSQMHDPEIKTTSAGGGDFTRISFVPDLEKLAKSEVVVNDDHSKYVIPEEDYAIMCRRVFDVAGCSDGEVNVTLNGQRVPISSFEDYAAMYRTKNVNTSYQPDDKQPKTQEETTPPLNFQRINARWTVGVGLSESGSFESASFVNGMATTRGGTHVNAIVQQVTKRIAEKIVKLHPDLSGTVTQGLVRRHLCVFVNALIENPTFDSQMKEYLTSSPLTFGSNFTLSEKFLNEIMKTDSIENSPGIMDSVVRAARGRQQASLLKEVGGSKKTRRQLLNIPKLDDAHMAGSDDSSKCTLILTEGDSAKALAVAGLEVIGREQFGVFPLRGKFLNVRDASITQLTNNQEVKALCSILGLDFDEDYSTKEDRAKLRYGQVMLMCDQDADGSHIKGLIINFFRHFWPDLLKPIDGDSREFISSFITPLLKAKKKGTKKSVEVFYTFAEYNAWRSSLPEDEVKKWTIKYYKGLGTSTPAEAKEYFQAFDKHFRPYRWNSVKDGQLLDMVFEKSRAQDRKDWLNDFDESRAQHQDTCSEKGVTFEEFINNEMIHFSNSDNVRSIPSVVDGLKPSQRKVLYACFKRNLKNEVKVAQLSGYCSEHTMYHHGEASLHATITSMAQDFVGSNNINLLVPSGQFGTRISGGKDAASPRYIFTSLSPIARLLFPEVDDALLSYLEDDGVLIEPKYYIPIIPLLLVNGCQGIGTGWSTSIPSHNPWDVLQYVRARLDSHDEDSLPSIQPWVRGFKGSLEIKEDGSGYRSTGKIKKVSKTSVLISELPVGKWTNDYKAHLLKMQSKGEIQSFVENHTTSTVSFKVTLKSVQLIRMMNNAGLEKAFKLISNHPTTNVHAFDHKNVITKYDSPESIVDAYFDIRHNLYKERKVILEKSKEHSAAIMRNKAKFVEQVIDGQIDLVRGTKSKIDTVNELEELGFQTISELDAILAENHEPETNENMSTIETIDLKQYDYLLNMPLSSLTLDKIEALQSDTQRVENDLQDVKSTTAESLWHSDLDKLEPHLKK